jgi:predicted ribonuclease toxin of YeeF-YezG toxin-antitoxin module
MGSLQNTKSLGPKEKHHQAHQNQNTQHTEQRKNSESHKRENTGHIQRQTHKNNSRFLNWNSKGKVMERHNTGPERKQLSIQTSLPSKTVLPN